MKHLILLVGAALGLVSSVPAQELLPADRPIGEVIDHYIDSKLRQAKVAPAPPAANTTIARRLHLDLIGRIPTPMEARAFLDSTDPLAKAKLIESLVSSPEFARHNAIEFDVMLRNDNPVAASVRSYLLQAFKENRPWDVMFRDLIGANANTVAATSEPVASPKGGKMLDLGASRPDAFVLKRLKDPDALTRDVASVFFGLNITCAQCHQHPEIKSLTQDYFFGMKAFFSYSYDFQGQLLERQFVKLADFKTKSGETRKPSLLFLSGSKVEIETLPDAELTKAIQEETKAIQEATKAKQAPPPPKFRPRIRLAETALDDANREMFARSIVNRLWFRFYGHGLVMRIDQMHANNESSHPELLQWLTRDLLSHNYDLTRLIGGLVSSRAYARTSEWKGDAPAKELFAVAVIRPLTPAQWGLSHRLASDPEALKIGETAEARLKALDLIESQQVGTIAKLIEQPREDLQIGITESLKLSNDPVLLKITGDKLVPVLRKLTEARQQVDQAVWSVLSRPASTAEVKILGEYLEQRKAKPDEALQHIVWALINSPEFRFNH